MQLIQQQVLKNQLVGEPIFKRKHTPEHSDAGFLETLVSDITYLLADITQSSPTFMLEGHLHSPQETSAQHINGAQCPLALLRLTSLHSTESRNSS